VNAVAKSAMCWARPIRPSAPGSIRRRIRLDIMVNAAHASESPEKPQTRNGIVNVGENNFRKSSKKLTGKCELEFSPAGRDCLPATIRNAGLNSSASRSFFQQLCVRRRKFRNLSVLICLP